MPNPTKRGGLREPKGGRPPKPSEKYVDIHLKVPPYQAEWLKLNRERTGKAVNAFIVEAIEQKIKELSR